MTTHTLNFFESNDLLAFIARDDLRSIRKFLREQQCQNRNVDTLMIVVNTLSIVDLWAFFSSMWVLRFLGGGYNINNIQFQQQEKLPAATLLHYSCYFGAVQIVEFLISEEKANVDSSGNDGLAPIDALIYTPETLTKNKRTIIRLLLDNGANPQYALQRACYDQNVDLVQMLLDNGANPQDALHIACDDKNLDLIRMLLDKGADPNFTDRAGNENNDDATNAYTSSGSRRVVNVPGTAFVIACSKGRVDVIKLFLLKSGPDKDTVNKLFFNFKFLLSRSAADQNIDNQVGSNLDTNKKREVLDVLTFYCCSLTAPAEWQKEAIQQRKLKREQFEIMAYGMVSAATTTAANIETSARINEYLNFHQRLIAHKACHMMSKLPIRDLRFEVLGYLTTSDVEQIFE